MSPLKPTQQISVVEFGHIMVALPAAKAIDLVKLLQSGAALADWDYSDLSNGRRSLKLHLRLLGEIRLTTVSADQIKGDESAPRSKKRGALNPGHVPGEAGD